MFKLCQNPILSLSIGCFSKLHPSWYSHILSIHSVYVYIYIYHTSVINYMYISRSYIHTHTSEPYQHTKIFQPQVPYRPTEDFWSACSKTPQWCRQGPDQNVGNGWVSLSKTEMDGYHNDTIIFDIVWYYGIFDNPLTVSINKICVIGLWMIILAILDIYYQLYPLVYLFIDRMTTISKILFMYTITHEYGTMRWWMTTYDFKLATSNCSLPKNGSWWMTSCKYSKYS